MTLRDFKKRGGTKNCPPELKLIQPLVQPRNEARASADAAPGIDEGDKKRRPTSYLGSFASEIAMIMKFLFVVKSFFWSLYYSMVMQILTGLIFDFDVT